MDASKATHILGVGKSATNPDFALRLTHHHGTEDYALVVWRKGEDVRDTMVVPAYNDGLWHHHAVIFAETTNATSGAVSTTDTCYLDYEQMSQKTVSYVRVLSQTVGQRKLRVGESWGTGHDYEIDEIRISVGVLGTADFMRRGGLGMVIIYH